MCLQRNSLLTNYNLKVEFSIPMMSYQPCSVREMCKFKMIQHVCKPGRFIGKDKGCLT